jgi:phosphoribosylaminoimidazolecarboxamide formyltransferase/IMP cyclohydrolase
MIWLMSKGAGMKIQRALISVSDKTDLVPFAQKLKRWGIEIISTGGTAKFLEENKVPVTLLSSITNFPEIMDGRVKTLHPLIFGGILGIRTNDEHKKQMAEHGIRPIDMVVVNLYPFEDRAVAKDLSVDDSIEWIDIGGPSLLRASAKNHAFVTVVTDPDDYARVGEELDKNEGSVPDETRKKLAMKVFQFTSYYDATIASHLSKKLDEKELPKFFPMSLKLSYSLRYGENPHQKGSLYLSPASSGASLAKAEKLQGKELSYNNLLDLDAAFQLSCALRKPSVVIIKHNNPCGVSVGDQISEVYRKARAADSVSAFGGVVAINGTVDEATAKIITEAFIEAIVAREFTTEARKVLSTKTNMRLLRLPEEWTITDMTEMKKIVGGALIQDRDMIELDRAACKVATRREPTEAEWKGLQFGWIVCQFVKSNAIVFTTDDTTVGVGAGQMSRVDSVKIAKIKAMNPLKGTVVASDAFFPFRDGVDEIASAGATAIIQPGGSIRDQECIDAANEHNIAMVFSGFRHFRH